MASRNPLGLPGDPLLMVRETLGLRRHRPRVSVVRLTSPLIDGQPDFRFFTVLRQSIRRSERFLPAMRGIPGILR